MKFGLVGTAFWARTVHAAGLAEHELVDFVGVWGRTPANVELVAREYGTRPYADFDALLEDVDAVAFAVPPDAQPGLALRAARAGKHLLLEKPVALSTQTAIELADAIDAAGVASAVFFTDLWAPGVSLQLASIRAEGSDWNAGRAEMLVSALADDGPYSSRGRRFGQTRQTGNRRRDDLVREWRDRELVAESDRIDGRVPPDIRV
jgi:predicted dehydrogenase